jgi:hypothetical protein
MGVYRSPFKKLVSVKALSRKKTRDVFGWRAV